MWQPKERSNQQEHGPQNGFPIWARGQEGLNIPHLGRTVHHAVQTSQQVPMATAPITKLCRTFFHSLLQRRSFIVKLSRVRLNQNVHPQIAAHLYTQRHEALYLVPQHSHRRSQLPHLRIAQLSSIEMGWPKKSIAVHEYKPSVYHRQRKMASNMHAKIAIPDTMKT